MKTLTSIFILIVLIVSNSCYLIKVPTEPPVQPVNKIAPIGWVHLQKLILPLFENVCEESTDPIVMRLAQDFSFDATNEVFEKADVISNLQKLKTEKGLLPKGEIFTEFNPSHMNELKTIYEVMYYAKNFDTFYKVAAWARQNLNCGLFVNAIYLTIENRRDTEKLSIPAPYEVLPNYFIQKDIIIQASNLLATGEITPSEGVRDDGNTYTLDANYTALFYDNDDESKLAYFREDVGLNSYYFLRKLKEAPWLNAVNNSRYGENMYQMMKQFMARYNLERYSNGLPELSRIYWNSSFDVPYDPMLIYSNGNEFIHRTGPIDFPDNEDVVLLQTIENNIGLVVNHMREGGYNKTQILNHLMEILVTGDRSYESLARQLLGKDLTENGYPSVLEHYMTSLRDPMFWILNKKLVDIIDEALQILPPYSLNEVYFPGVEILNIDVKKMMTVFDYHEFDVTEALKIAGNNTTFQVKIGQPRLNHKPFNIKINILSLVSSKGLLKIYLGPKVLPGELAKKKNSFVLLDVFEYNFKVGENIITRGSEEMKHFSNDYMSLKTIRKRVQYAEFGLDSLPLLTVSSQTGYPDRLILPKGTFSGLPLQLFVFVAPFVKANYGSMRPQTDMVFNTAILSPGYPLDLMIDNKQLLSLPNAMLKDVFLTHKGDSKVENYGGNGITKKWYGTSIYDPSAPVGNREPFDYAAKKGQYGRKVEFENNDIEAVHERIDSTDINSDTILSTESGLRLLGSMADFDYTTNERETSYNYKGQYGNKNTFYSKREYPKFNYNSKKDQNDKSENYDTKTIQEINKDDTHVVTELIDNVISINTEPTKRSIDNEDIKKVENKRYGFEFADKGRRYGKKDEIDFQFNDNAINHGDIVASNVNKTVIASTDSGYRLLGSTAGFDYTAKKKERESSYNYKGQYGNKDDFPAKREYSKFDYKAKKDQYGKKEDYSTKIFQDINKNDNIVTEVIDLLIPTETESIKPSNDKEDSKQVENKGNGLNFADKIEQYEKKEETESGFNNNKINREVIDSASADKDIKESTDSEFRLLGSTESFDYTAKKKEREQYGNKGDFSAKREYPKFDYNAIKDRYGKRGDKLKDNNIVPIVNDDLFPEEKEPTNLDTENDKKVENEVKERIAAIDTLEEILNAVENTTNIREYVNNDENSYKVIPILKLNSQNRRKFSIYDYIVQAYDNDDLNEKVYE